MLSDLFQNLCAELRARRDAEHLYTAALVGALGAVSWGVATLATTSSSAAPYWRHPALAGALACFLMAAGVLAKIYREHTVYVRLRLEQVTLVTLFAASAGVPEKELPVGLRPGGKAGKGYRYSCAIVILSTIGAIYFCLTVWQFK